MCFYLTFGISCAYGALDDTSELVPTVGPTAKTFRYCAPSQICRFVVVPGVGTSPVEKWHDDDDNECWLRSVGQHRASEIAMYTYANELASGGVLSCKQIEEGGADFLGILQDSTEIPEVVCIPRCHVRIG